MRFEIESTKSDFIEASMFTRRRNRRVVSLFLALAGFVCLYSGVQRYRLRDYDNMPLFVGLGVSLLTVTFSSAWNVRRVISKLWNQHPIYQEPKIYTLNDDGFTSDSYSGTSTMRWHAFSHWVETPRLFMLYFGPVISYYIPKRSIGDQQQINALREFLQAVIGRTKYTPPVRAFPVESPVTVPNADESPARSP
jgi:hypothetical protein